MKWNTIMAGPRAGRVVCAIFIAVAFAVPAFSAASKDTGSATDTGIFVEKVAGLPADYEKAHSRGLAAGGKPAHNQSYARCEKERPEKTGKHLCCQHLPVILDKS